MRITNPTTPSKSTMKCSFGCRPPVLDSFSELNKYRIRTENLGFASEVLSKGGMIATVSAFAFMKSPYLFLGTFSFGALSTIIGSNLLRNIHANMTAKLEAAKSALFKI